MVFRVAARFKMKLRKMLETVEFGFYEDQMFWLIQIIPLKSQNHIHLTVAARYLYCESILATSAANSARPNLAKRARLRAPLQERWLAIVVLSRTLYLEWKEWLPRCPPGTRKPVSIVRSNCLGFRDRVWLSCENLLSECLFEISAPSRDVSISVNFVAAANWLSST